VRFREISNDFRIHAFLNNRTQLLFSSQHARLPERLGERVALGSADLVSGLVEAGSVGAGVEGHDRKIRSSSAERHLT
jgi:hypothetical protein